MHGFSEQKKYGWGTNIFATMPKAKGLIYTLVRSCYHWLLLVLTLKKIVHSMKFQFLGVC